MLQHFREPGAWPRERCVLQEVSQNRTDEILTEPHYKQQTTQNGTAWHSTQAAFSMQILTMILTFSHVIP